MTPRLCVIHWMDAIGRREDEMESTNEPLRAVNCLSVGILIERTRGRKGHIKIAAELVEGGGVQEIVVIPNGMVLSVKFLELPIPKELGSWKLEK